MLKSFANIIELDISSPDTRLIFAPFGGVWIASINEIYSLYKDSYFDELFSIKENELYNLFNIGSVSVDNDRGYIEVFSLEALYKQNKSYYQYKKDNINYIAIHFNNFETPYSKKNIIINIKRLFSTREWDACPPSVLDSNNNSPAKGTLREAGSRLITELNNMYVEPRVEEIDTADIEGDSLAFDTIQTNEMSVTLRNDDGLFDDFSNLYGNRFLVRQIFDGSDFDNSNIIFSGFIQKPEYSFLETVTITASDIRASFSAELPKNVFSEKEYSDLKNFPENVQSGEDTIDTCRTLAAGHGITVKLKPIKYYTPSILNPDLIPEVVFEICDTSRHAIESIVNRNDPLDENKLKPHIYFIETPESENEIIEREGTVISGELEIFIPEFKDYNDGKGSQRVWTLDKEKGQLIFRGHKQVHSITDTNDNLYEIYAEIDIPPYKSLTFIREILEDYENIAYIKENYNIENWQIEEERSREIAVLLDNDNKKTTLDLIGELSFLEQGRLEIDNNKIDFRSTRFRENKAKYKIKQYCMGRVDKTVEEGEYLSSCSIKYDLLKSTYKNIDFEEEAKKRHRINAHEEFETLLKRKEDAVSLSNEIMKSRYLLKEYYTFEYYETLDFLKLFDIVEFEYKRENGTHYIKPCKCEILKLNIFDNVIKLRQL
ncbi:hypothetical protein OFR22_14515 [Brachyspira hyodysenteriae]|uniref:hypothetical protein n=1 Tax=Brachyspira hyodysenteriae TaxID=159 RepID=UPI0022CD32E8|nr:hypothetical protein [Brachyspira hyodysenteriae]MCZ9847498.1 hypothetical protein [Brachyspira hyodysenteriae]MCZ9847506.1 hypothetical protein [Brachyspira hyodysenteriae]MCZ9851538.1 hypothetical protein [Brachyspira hyodysenteriae]MCZ9859734.1 hypothetical protein [Brachyspira hyodysenteriae]MCZ9869108.1 hypothetical protein [Brachyspira hyodysenteriae]